MDGLLGNLFGVQQEDPLLALLPPEQRARLQAQTRSQGIANLGLALLSRGVSDVPVSFAQSLGQAGMQAMQANQGLMDRNLERLLTSRRLQQEEATRSAREAAIEKLPENLRPLARIDPTSLGELYKYSVGLGVKKVDVVTPSMRSDLQSQGINLDPNKNYQIDRMTGQLSELGGTGGLSRPSLNANEISLIKRLGWGDDPRSWSPEQGEVWRKIQMAPTETEQTRLITDAKRLKFETGQDVGIPITESQILRNLFPPGGASTTGVPKATGVPQTSRAPSSVVQAVAPATAPTGSIFEQVTPKEQQQLLLDRPRAERNVSVVVDKASRLKSLVGNLLSNEEGLKRSTGLASKVPSIPGGPAYQAQSDLKNLKERVSLETVNQMRELSKTGGAIGNITEREWPRLESALTNLDQAQSYDQIVKRLKEVNDIMDGYIRDVNKAFEDTYGTKTQASGVQLTPQSRQFLTPSGQRAYEKYR